MYKQVDFSTALQAMRVGKRTRRRIDRRTTLEMRDGELYGNDASDSPLAFLGVDHIIALDWEIVKEKVAK